MNRRGFLGTFVAAAAAPLLPRVASRPKLSNPMLDRYVPIACDQSRQGFWSRYETLNEAYIYHLGRPMTDAEFRQIMANQMT